MNHLLAQRVPSNIPSLAAHAQSTRRQSSVASEKDHLLLTCSTLTSASLPAVIFALRRLVWFIVCSPAVRRYSYQHVHINLTETVVPANFFVLRLAAWLYESFSLE
jgi:hypothetical protein